MDITRLLSLTTLFFLTFPISAQELVVPDFSKDMPDVTLERKEAINGLRIYHLKTALSSKEFSTTLSKFLGAGWGKRKLTQEEMILVANKGRASNAEVSLAVYQNSKIPGVDIHVLHLKQKEENAGSSVEIHVMREADEGHADREKVEFFEKLYKVKIDGVKPLEEYKDPDSFYAAIAKQVGIPQKAFDAVEKKYGWKQNEEFFLSAMVKGGPGGDYWGVMVTRFPSALKEAKSEEEKIKLLEKMEMKMVVIDYDGSVSYPEKRDSAEQSGADQPATAPDSEPEGNSKSKHKSEGRPK